MSFESHHGSHSRHTEPGANEISPAVQAEAAKIIAKLDGKENSRWHIDDPRYDSERAQQARDMLLEDAQKMSPKEMMDLMRTVMKNEDKTRGYDMNWSGHTEREIREKAADQAQDRQIFFTALNKDCDLTPKQRQEKAAAFNEAQKCEMERYSKELLIMFTHQSIKPSQENNYTGRSPGDWMRFGNFNVKNGLPEFHIDDKGK